MTLRLYGVATAGAPLWTEVHDGTTLPKVTAVNGIISVVLGQGTPLDPSLIDPTSERWVAVELAGQEVARVKLTASAYAVSAASASSLWDPATSTALDFATLDQRWVRTSGTGGGVLRTLNAVPPDAAGNFQLLAGPSGRLSITPTTAGLRLETAQPVDSLNGQTGSVSIVAGSNVSVATNGGTITINAQAGGITQADADARYVNRDGEPNGLELGTLGVFDLTVHNVIQVTTLRGGNSIRLETPAISTSGNLDMNGSGSISGVQNVQGTGSLSIGGVSASGGTFQANIVRAARIEAVEKFFVVPHPNDSTKEIVYAALEGPECAMFVRGSAALANGAVTIALPEHFTALAKADSVTVSVTATADCRGLWVPSKTSTQFEVRELQGGTSNASFDYVVYARRCNHAALPVRDKVQ